MRTLLPAGRKVVLTTALLLLAAAVVPSSDAFAQPREVRLDAVVAKGGTPINDTVEFAVWALDNGDPQGVVARHHGAPARVRLEPGDYRVVAEYGAARRVQDIRVSDELNQGREINLKAGEVALRLVANVGGETVRAPLVWHVRRYARGAEEGSKVATLEQYNPRLLLREGWYEVEVNHDGRLVKHAIEVTAGRRYDYTLVMSQ